MSDSDSAAPLQETVASLRKELAALEERVAEPEAKVGHSDTTLPAGASDYLDARVLEVLDSGQIVPVHVLHTLYDERTDIRNDDVRRERVKDLVESVAFTNTGDRRWRYDPSQTEE